MSKTVFPVLRKIEEDGFDHLPFTERRGQASLSSVFIEKRKKKEVVMIVFNVW